MNDAAAKMGAFVRGKIARLSGSPSESAGRAALAKLRRGIGKMPGSMPELWEATMAGFPEELSGRADNPSFGEWAAHTALTLYALHQQGKDPKEQCMHRDGEALGLAVRRLVKSKQDEARIKRRFDAAATAESVEEFSHHLRGLVQLLKAEDIPLDYAALAGDLYLFQISGARDGVRLRWGRDFYRFRKDETVDAGQA